MSRLLARLFPTPKHMITALITAILVIGEWSYGVVGGYDKLVVTIGLCVVFEELLSRFILGKRPVSLQSAYISGVSLTILLRPQAGIWWPFIAGAFLTIGSKYVLRYRGRHLWNPSNLAIMVLVLLAPSKIAILSHEFGNDIAGNVVIWVLGLMVASRAKVLHISVTYAASFVVWALVRSAIVGSPPLAEIAPLTGPMYQLMVFFMLTDPRTTVSSRRGRVLVVAIIAFLEGLIRLGNDLDVPLAAPFAPAPPILALAIVGPVALALDLARKRTEPVGTSIAGRPATA